MEKAQLDSRKYSGLIKEIIIDPFEIGITFGNYSLDICSEFQIILDDGSEYQIDPDEYRGRFPFAIFLGQLLAFEKLPRNNKDEVRIRIGEKSRLYIPSSPLTPLRCEMSWFENSSLIIHEF